MLEWLRGHGVDDVIMSCGFLAGGVRDVLGDGSAHGVRLRYVEEPEPLGTGGALKFAEDLLDERFLMLNGDVLTDLDVTAQLALHEARGARGTLALTPGRGPDARTGSCAPATDGEVTGFVEKPAPDQIDTRNISAGIYVLERSVLELLEPGRRASIERDVFPRLVGDGLYALRRRGLLARHRDARSATCRARPTSSAEPSARACAAAPALIAGDAALEDGARVGDGVVLGAGVRVGAGSTVERAVVFDGATIGAGCTLRDCVVAAGARVGDGTRVEGYSMLGEGVRVGAGNVITNGARLFPGVDIPDGGMLF